ncbi:MAG: hypothetical protein M1817_005075 [Caeruleum heppii]|nr:MAG: hypothetical protein M1817_005075 [Caeruleum heppii]
MNPGLVTHQVSEKVGGCTAFYTCDDRNEYPKQGVTGPVIARWLESIWTDEGCQKCGSRKLGKSCRVTYNYAV